MASPSRVRKSMVLEEFLKRPGETPSLGFRLPVTEVFGCLDAGGLVPTFPLNREPTPHEPGRRDGFQWFTEAAAPLRRGDHPRRGPARGRCSGTAGDSVRLPDAAVPRPAIWYRAIVQHLLDHQIAYADEARAYDKVNWTIRVDKEAFPHQAEGLKAWWDAGRRGVVVLPTGTGKTHLANLIIAKAQRPTLVVTPTIDLMNQWFDELTLSFATEVGLLGGGYYDVQPLTVTTYDSAYMNMDRLGNRFGLIVFDECHHLPGPTYGQSALCAIAPFRLGLTATPERADNAHTQLDQLIGPIVYRREITQLRGRFLADYRVETLYVNLTDEQRLRYERPRGLPGVPPGQRHRYAAAQRLEQVRRHGSPFARGPASVPRLPRAARAGAGRPRQARVARPPARPAQRRPDLDLHP